MVRRIRTPVPMPRNSRENIRATIKGGIGHNLPQEAPRAFAQAVVDVDPVLISRRNRDGIGHKAHLRQRGSSASSHEQRRAGIDRNFQRAGRRMSDAQDA